MGQAQAEQRADYQNAMLSSLGTQNPMEMSTVEELEEVSDRLNSELVEVVDAILAAQHRLQQLESQNASTSALMQAQMALEKLNADKESLTRRLNAVVDELKRQGVAISSNEEELEL
eukprot:TRINITY_DN10587_c0_g1_i2.p1 TRINITY_DN10587_c0_g1~~TRINITY_DN10587_c0_g1_i2.p1  ORF type:complete len:127 (-),score=51.93 TRINITY_DN10587_c0_g1_i2:88-438(-)